VKNDIDVLDYFIEKQVKPATALENFDFITENRGIGFMRVASTFKVD
jgi:hypothetical protein